MGRPKKWANDAERMAAKRSDTPGKRTVNEQIDPGKRTKRAVNEQNKRTQSSKRTGINWHPEIDQSTFDGRGRGVPVNGYVLVSLGAVLDGKPECGVVTHVDWLARLETRCAHGLHGWSCKPCLG